MKTIHKALQSIIEELIVDEEASLSTKLHIEDHAFLVATCSSFVIQNIHKYIAGAKEHHDSSFLDDVDHANELAKEFLDGWNYLAALRLKQHRHDTRYISTPKKNKCTSPKKQ